MRWIVAACVMLLSFGQQTVWAESLVYQETLKDKIIIKTVTSEKTETGGMLTIVGKQGNQTVTQAKLITDENQAVLEWKVMDVGYDYDIHAIRKNNHIHISGTRKGKPLKKTLSIDNKPWLQYLPHGLESFSLSEATHLEFWVLTPDMTAIKFLADKKGQGKVALNGKEQNACCIHVTLDGWRSMFWSADYYMDPNDGKYLYFKGIINPGEAETEIQLIDSSGS